MEKDNEKGKSTKAKANANANASAAQPQKKSQKKAVDEAEKTTPQNASEVDVSTGDSELQKIKEELDRQKDLALRTAAEFDNYKKRTERERLSSLEFMKADILKSFLPVLDNFGRALEADAGSEDFSHGIEMIKKQLNDVMVKLGLSEINDEGKKFDPQLHQAVLHTEDDSLGENIVVKTLQKGYKIGDTVIRPAMVQVAN